MDSLEEIDTFLETCNLPTLNQEERENLTDPELLKKIESVIKKKSLSTNKSLRPEGSQVNFTKYSKNNTYPSQTIPKTAGKALKLILWPQHYPDTKTGQRHYKKYMYVSRYPW